MEPAAEHALLAHARWLVDRQAIRLSSIEARASAVIGWASTQVAITLAVIALVVRLPDTAWRPVGVALLVAAVVALTGAVLTAIFGVYLVRPVPAPETDLTKTFHELVAHEGDTRELDLTRLLLGALLEPSAPDATEVDQRDAVLPDLAKAVDARALWLKRATIGLGGAVCPRWPRRDLHCRRLSPLGAHHEQPAAG